MVPTPAAVLLQEWFAQTNWSAEHSYTALTSTSRHLLDFNIPPGIQLNLTNRPTDKFASSLALSALVPAHPATYQSRTAPTLVHTPSPTLAGQLTYVASSVELGRGSTRRSAGGGEGVDLKHLLSGFRIGGVPSAPELRDGAQATWQGGERVDRPGE